MQYSGPHTASSVFLTLIFGLVLLLLLNNKKEYTNILCRVATRQGKVREKCFFSRSGKCQGILKFVREKLNFGKCH